MPVRLVLLALLTTAFALPACRTTKQASEVLNSEGSPVGEHSPLVEFTAAIGAKGREVLCTAVLVAPQLVLTAAHCLPEQPGTELLVRFGRMVAAETKSYAVLSYERHEKFDGADRAKGFDLGVAYLAEAPAGRKPVALQKASSSTLEVYEDQVTVAGFGALKEPIVDADPALSGVGILRSAEASASGVLGAKTASFDALSVSNACYGNSGGPALVKKLDGAFELIGVASYLPGAPVSDCSAGVALYSDVAAHREWIEQKMRGSSRLNAG